MIKESFEGCGPLPGSDYITGLSLQDWTLTLLSGYYTPTLEGRVAHIEPVELEWHDGIGWLDADGEFINPVLPQVWQLNPKRSK